MNKIQFLRLVRHLVFKDLGNSRFKRVLICSFFIATVWCIADAISGNLSFNIWHDLICLGLGIVTERMLPWGKYGEMESLRRNI